MHRDRKERESFVDLASILARAFLRLPESARRGAVSSAGAEQKSVDVSALSRPDVGGNEAA